MKTTIRLLLSLTLAACGSGEAQPPPEDDVSTAGAETVAREDSTSGAATEESPAEATERTCAQTAEAFGQALADVFEEYTAPADPAAMEEPLEWSELQAWNDLQSARYRVEEGDDLGRLSFRYHAWGSATPALRDTLRSGPLQLDGEDERLGLVIGDPEDPMVTVHLAREDGCLRLDEN